MATELVTVGIGIQTTDHRNWTAVRLDITANSKQSDHQCMRYSLGSLCTCLDMLNICVRVPDWASLRKGVLSSNIYSRP